MSIKIHINRYEKWFIRPISILKNLEISNVIKSLNSPHSQQLLHNPFHLTRQIHKFIFALELPNMPPHSGLNIGFKKVQ